MIDRNYDLNRGKGIQPLLALGKSCKPIPHIVGAIVVVLLFAASTPWEQESLASEPPITDIAFAPDGKSLVSCSQKGMQVFSWPELSLQKTVEISCANLHCVVFSPDGNRLAVGGGDPSEEGVVEIFSWPECKSLSKLSYHDDSVLSVVWIDDTNLISASLDRLLIQVDLEKNRRVKTFQGHSRGIGSVCILRNGELVTAGHDQSVRVWNVDSAELIRSLNQHSQPINSIAVCPNSSGQPMVATAADDRTIRFWQPGIGRMLRYVRLESEPLDIAWIHESRIVASCVDGQARVVDTDNVEVLQTIPVINGWAYAIAIHPSDGTVAVAGSDGQLQRVSLQKTD